MREFLAVACAVAVFVLGLWVFTAYPPAGGGGGTHLGELFLSKEAKSAQMRLSNLERSHPNSRMIQSLRQSFERAPENMMLHDSIGLFAEYSDVLEFAEMSESDRKKVSLVKTALFLPRLYKFNSAMTQHARKWGLELPKLL